MTEDDKKALSQQVKYSHSYKYDLVKDNSQYKFTHPRDLALSFDLASIREGVVLRKDGLIRTSKGTMPDPSSLGNLSPVEQRRAALAGELLLDRKPEELAPLNSQKAFKHCSAYRRDYANVDFS